MRHAVIIIGVHFGSASERVVVPRCTQLDYSIGTRDAILGLAGNGPGESLGNWAVRPRRSKPRIPTSTVLTRTSIRTRGKSNRREGSTNAKASPQRIAARELQRRGLFRWTI